MSVMNRQREIGILKAMGATRRQVIRVFTLEGTLLASLGACLGAIVGSVICRLLFQLRTTASATGRQIEVFPMDLRWNTVLTAMAIAVLVGFFASLYPAWRAARTNPVEVIR
jgi:ABC-type lipoprotein release transport system permease subunit